MTVLDYPCGCIYEHLGETLREGQAPLTSVELRKLCTAHKNEIKQTRKEMIKRNYENALREIDEAEILPEPEP